MIAAQIDTTLLSRKLSELQLQQVPFALSLAINKVAATVREKEELNLKFAINRPTSFTVRSVLLSRPANKRGPFQRDVFLRDEATKGTPPAKYLEPLVRGGPRRKKRFERALEAAGILGRNEFTVPGKGARLNQYGNMSAGQIVQILSGLKAFSETGFIANRSSRPGARKNARTKGYFVARRGRLTERGRERGSSRLPEGIWQNYGNRKIRPLLLFVRPPRYQPILKFRQVAEQVFRSDFSKEFSQALRQSLRTAKR
jgi:hypothetical protein